MTAEDLKNDEIRTAFGLIVIASLIVMVYQPYYGFIVACISLVGYTATLLAYMYLISQ